jgi:hypothetical protein
MAFSIARNHWIPVSPACCEKSHSRILVASSSASADVSTRKAMSSSQLGDEFGCGPGAAGLYILAGAADANDRLLEILPIPFQVSAQSVIESCYGILTVPMSIVIQLCLPFRLQGHHLHSLKATDFGLSCQTLLSGTKFTKGLSHRISTSRARRSGCRAATMAAIAGNIRFIGSAFAKRAAKLTVARRHTLA